VHKIERRTPTEYRSHNAGCEVVQDRSYDRCHAPR
jgi:hypothetical protein